MWQWLMTEQCSWAGVQSKEVPVPLPVAFIYYYFVLYFLLVGSTVICDDIKHVLLVLPRVEGQYDQISTYVISLFLSLMGRSTLLLYFFYNFIRHVSLNLNYGNTGKEISPLKLQWKHLIEKAVNCHFCFAGWGNEEERETCCLWAGRAPAKAGPACRCSGASLYRGS